MNARFGSIIAVIVMIAIVMGTIFLGILPKLAEAGIAEADRADVEMQNDLKVAEIARLAELDANLEQLQADLTAARVSIPETLEASNFVREIFTIGASTGVVITGVSATDAVIYEQQVDGLQDPELLAAQASVSGSDFVVVTVQLDYTGPYDGVMAAIDAIQHASRYGLVYVVDIDEGLPGGSTVVEGALTMQIFVKTEEPLIPADGAEPAGTDTADGAEG